MRILTLSDVYFPRINGVSTSIATFREEARRRGHEMVLIAPRYGGEENGDGVVRIASRHLFFDPEDRLLRCGELMGAARRLAAEAPFDVLHVQTPFVAHHAGVRLAAELGLPVVETYHTYFEEYLFHYLPVLPRPWMGALARRLTRSQCNRLDAVVVPSSAMRRVLERYGVERPIEVIPTGLRLEELSGGDGLAFRRRHGIPERRPTLVHIGRLAYEKNVGFLLEVLAAVRAELPEVLLVIAGEGPAEASLRRRATRLGLVENVLFVGYLARDGALLDCYRAGDGFVFASRTETQGLVLLEAMALGVPVVSTAVMGTRDVLEGCRGALVAEESVEDFKSKVLLLLRHHELRHRLSREAVCFAARWSAGESTERMLELYRRLADGGRGANDAHRAGH